MEGKVQELTELLRSGAVRSLKVVDGDGCHVLNLAVKHKQQAVVQVRAATAAQRGRAARIQPTVATSSTRHNWPPASLM